jgi:hypothetical protein
MAFLEWLQGTSFAVWVAESDTIWGYPAVLTLHTVGFGILVGANTIVNLRLLGVGSAVPLSAMRGFFKPMWIGLVVNALTGATLFAAAATEKGLQTVFYVKLALILLALLVLRRIRAIVRGEAGASGSPGGGARVLAVTSLLLWTGAITAGRLMAYLH